MPSATATRGRSTRTESSFCSRVLPLSVPEATWSSTRSRPRFEDGTSDGDDVARTQEDGTGQRPVVDVRAVRRPEVLDVPLAVGVVHARVPVRDGRVRDRDVAA